MRRYGLDEFKNLVSWHNVYSRTFRHLGSPLLMPFRCMHVTRRLQSESAAFVGGDFVVVHFPIHPSLSNIRVVLCWSLLCCLALCDIELSLWEINCQSGLISTQDMPSQVPALTPRRLLRYLHKPPAARRWSSISTRSALHSVPSGCANAIVYIIH